MVWFFASFWFFAGLILGAVGQTYNEATLFSVGVMFSGVGIVLIGSSIGFDVLKTEINKLREEIKTLQEKIK